MADAPAAGVADVIEVTDADAAVAIATAAARRQPWRSRARSST